jgi:hypothetical protein
MICSQNKKKHQRKINHCIRAINNLLANSEYNRFYCHQVGSPQWYRFSDGSGYDYIICIEFVDKITNSKMLRRNTVNYWSFWNGAHLYEIMYDFANKCLKTERKF